MSKCLATEVEELARRGHEVTVLTRKHFPESADRERTASCEIVRHAAPMPGSRLYYLHPLNTVRRVPDVIRKLHAEKRFDATYANNTFHAAALARANLPTGNVWGFHAPAAPEILLDASQGKYGPLTPLAKGAASWVAKLEREALLGMDAVFTRSQFMARQIEENHPGLGSRITHAPIPLMVDTERFAFAGSCVPTRTRLGLPEDRRILLTVRRLVARMGLQNLVNAMRAVVDEHPDTLLLIAGKGYLEAELKELITKLGLEQHVRLLGFVSEEDLPAYYQSADLSVIPSAELEGFGLVSIESMSCGTPVLATPVGGNTEVVGGLHGGLLTDDNTVEAIGKGLRRWVREGLTPTFREASRTYCTERFSPQRVGDLLEGVLVQAAEGRMRRGTAA